MDKTEKTIGEHVKELMTYSKKDLAVMYANLHWCYGEITKSLVKRVTQHIKKKP